MQNLLITFLASFLLWFMFAGLLVLWLVGRGIKKEQVIHAVVACLIAWFVTSLIKIVFPTPRPYELYGTFPLTLTIPTDPAFPSGHASAAFALAISVQRHNKRMGLLFILFAILVGVGRVLGNVHFYSDIIGGAVVGGLSVFILEKLHGTKLLRRR